MQKKGMVICVSKKSYSFFSWLTRKRQAQGGRWLKNRSLLFVNDCSEDKPNTATGVFLQALIIKIKSATYKLLLAGGQQNLSEIVEGGQSDHQTPSAPLKGELLHALNILAITDTVSMPGESSSLHTCTAWLPL